MPVRVASTSVDVPFTSERFMPGFGGLAIHLEHLHRYYLAASLAAGNVLDLGCGVGYGSRLLSGGADQVAGIDLAPDAVQFARTRFPAPNLCHLVGDCRSLPFVPSAFDAVICFELIEHVREADAVLAEARRVLSPGGVLVISTPNRPIYSDARSCRNPYHQREYNAEQFSSLLAPHFSHVTLYGQRVVASSWTWSVLRPEGPRCLKWIHVDPALAPGIAEDHEPMYFVAICSSRPIRKRCLLPPDSLVTGSLDSLFAERDRHIAGLGEHTANLERIVADREQHIVGLGEHTANLERIVAERDQHIADQALRIDQLREEATNLEAIVTDLRRFEARVKGTFIYKLYRLLRLHRLLNRSAGT